MQQLYQGGFKQAVISHHQHFKRHFISHQSDVFVSTPPKAGTTWMTQILHQLKTGGDESFTNIYDIVPWLEWPSCTQTSEQLIAQINNIAPPRVFKTHLNYDAKLNNQGKTVVIVRDPADCCLSFYYHRLGMSEQTRQAINVTPPTDLDTFVDDWIQSEVWLNHMLSWWPHRNDSDVLWLEYKTMKQDIDGVLDQLLTFLNWTITTAQRNKVKHFISFDYMSSHQDRFSNFMKLPQAAFAEGQFIRKGKQGEGRKVLSPQLQQKIADSVYAKLPAQCKALFTQ